MPSEAIMNVSNAQVARLLRDYSAMLVVSGADRFKAKAYRVAAETIESMQTDLATFISSGHDLQELPGVGKAISSVIREILQTGQMPQLENLSSHLDPVLVELASRPGLDSKRVATVYKKLQIGSLAELQERSESGVILEKFGSRMDFHIRQGLANRPRMLIKRADQTAAPIEDFIRSIVGLTRVELTGSLRRRQETIGDLNFLVTGDSARNTFKHFQSYAGVESSEQQGPGRIVCRLTSGTNVTLNWTRPEAWGLNWILTTGSEGHLGDLKRAGDEMEIELTERGLSRRHVKIADERSVYVALKMTFIEPELREGRGEVQAALESRLPDLVRLADIKGDLHMHTTASDGVNTLAEMAASAQEKGYKYVAITDHSRSLKIANGLSEDRLREHILAIDALNSQLKGFTVLKSAEVDILEHGNLDYSDELLQELDLTVCSVHSHFTLSKEQNTERILRAMDNPYFNILGHPTGRLLLKRPGYEIDIDRILTHAKQNGCFLEINSNPNRLDLSGEHAKLAKDLGLKIAINTDAHSIRELDFMPFGINQARRAWLARDDVLNALPVARLKRALRRS
ncbi:MAG: polymerase family [Planctomycetaceae bacterium]|nr:polymerase family [Planctomycetaceae bacterium]